MHIDLHRVKQINIEDSGKLLLGGDVTKPYWTKRITVQMEKGTVEIVLFSDKKIKINK